MAKIKTKDAVKGSIKQIDKAEHSVDAAENNPNEYASDRIENTVDHGVHEVRHQADKVCRWGVRTTKENISKAKDGVRNFKEKRATESLRKQTTKPYNAPKGKGNIRAVDQTEKTIKQTARSSGKKTIKTVGKGSAKTAQRATHVAKGTAKAVVAGERQR